MGAILLRVSGQFERHHNLRITILVELYGNRLLISLTEGRFAQEALEDLFESLP